MVDLPFTCRVCRATGLGIRIRNVTARSNYRSDLNENRLDLSYTWTQL